MKLAQVGLRALLGRRLPITGGTIKVPGLDAPVIIHRDAYGIPYVEAEAEADGWYGLGFCQGQDRAFQLESQLRVARGTLAEWLGPAGLAIDRLSRRIGFRRTSEHQLTALDAEFRCAVEAFARGVADGMTLGSRHLAHEFVLLRARPTPYEAADALAVLKLQAFLLESNWAAELCRLRVLAEDGPDALRALDPACPREIPVGALGWEENRDVAARLTDDISLAIRTQGATGMSNGWAVAAWRTAAKRPILASDPHLAPVLPPHWYLAHVRTSAWTAVGASFVGAPGFLAGHNEFAAWGVTASLADTADLFIEEVGSDGRSLRAGDRFVPCEMREEVINVRDGAPHVETVLVGPRGPLIGPALAGEKRALSLQATWLTPRRTEALVALHRAQSFDEMRAILARGSGLGISLIYADRTGRIAWQIAGDTPQRHRGWGTLPRPGWDPTFAWADEPIPFADLPCRIDPSSGQVATANNPPPVTGQVAFLGTDWLDTYRYDRIVEVLENRGDWNIAAMQGLHMDRVSLPWRALRETLLALLSDDPDAIRALVLLRDWDGNAAPDSAAATVFELFLAKMKHRIVRAKAPRSADWILGAGFTPLLPHSIMAVRGAAHLVHLLREQPQGWLDRTWPHAMVDALAFAVRTLRAKYGDDSQQWHWGRVRQLTFRHPLGEHRLLRRIFNRGPFPGGGDTNTICQASVDPFDPTGDPLYVPSLRIVIDVGHWGASRFALPGGQSGNPLSPHYDDLLPFWRRGDGVSIAWDPVEVARCSRTCLRIVPGSWHPPLSHR